jgi:hypothetical protein
MTNPRNEEGGRVIILHFPWPEIEKLLEEIKAAATARPLYGDTTGKGFWLVGDDGVYLMANTTDGPHEKARKQGEPKLAVYAIECNPSTCAFDDWWAVKQATFGGDDGIEFIPASGIPGQGLKPKPRYLTANITKQSVTFGLSWK